jgi:saccharopine dehydrogenase-like NADP-dependent oxidoreductase
MTRVLVIGAGGVFGSRLAKGLVRDGFEVVVAGRSLARAEATVLDVGAASAVALDTHTLTAADLEVAGVSIVVDAAGLFQGAEPRVAAAAIAAGLHYVDLADARDFVAGFSTLDDAAKAAGVTALTGASSTPALSNAVLDALTEGWTRIDAVEAAISPGARAPRGQSVTEAILSWLGRPVRVFEGGAWSKQTGWGEVRARDFGPAGRRRLSLCETPDLDVLAERFGPSDRAVFLAGLVPGFAHRGAWLLARLVSLTGADVRKLTGLVIFFSRLAGPFGSDMGAMRVEAVGRDAEGCAVRAVWLLIAPSGAGPVTPGIPALAAVKALAAGRLEPGARVCVGELPLADLEAELAQHGITTTTTVEPSSLFERAIGPAFETLPAPIRALHETTGRSVWRGQASVEGAVNSVAGLVARVFGFPRAAPGVPVEVRIDADRDRSIWRREIADSRFRSRLSSPQPGGRVVESFGLCAFDLTLSPEDGRLVYRVEGWRLLGLRMPKAWAPTTETHEKEDAEGRFAFDVEIGLPIAGRMVRYRGWLERV